jgi:hypothetical protein
MRQSFKQGDRVKWSSHGGEAVGRIEKKITEETEAGGRKVKASRTSRSTWSAARNPAARRCTNPTR